jgi:predicted Zn-dependent protease
MSASLKVRSTQWAHWIAGFLALAALSPIAHGQFGGLRKYADKVQKVHEATKPMTVEEEQEIGREVAAKMVAAFHVYRNDALSRYVNLVGATVAAQSERQDIKYHFAVLDSDDINAFSAPGGYVFITRGALKLCEDEAELAGVLAHEVGHVAGKHVIHIVEHDKALRAGMDEASAHTPGSAYLQNMSKNILVKIFDQGLAPADEFDADSRGVRYAHAAGYPADGLERFLVRLDQATNQGANSFFTRTHPPVKDRNERIQQQITTEHWEDADRPTLADRFTTLTAMLKTKAGS